MRLEHAHRRPHADALQPRVRPVRRKQGRESESTAHRIGTQAEQSDVRRLDDLRGREDLVRHAPRRDRRRVADQVLLEEAEAAEVRQRGLFQRDLVGRLAGPVPIEPPRAEPGQVRKDRAGVVVLGQRQGRDASTQVPVRRGFPTTGGFMPSVIFTAVSIFWSNCAP